MTRVLQRTNFHSSKLALCLTALELVDAAAPENAFGEKLGLWVHFAVAITLSAVHNDGGRSLPDIESSGYRSAQVAVSAEFDKTQAIMTDAVMTSCASNPGPTHIVLHAPVLALPLDLAATYLPYRRFYEAHQRDMESRVAPLRVNVREALATASPRLRQLAELDATLENILRDRERKLLAKVPVLLRQRFEHLYKEHQQLHVQLCAHTQRADTPAEWMQAGGWLAHFCSDLQMLLLAEVALRLQPTLGLIEALTEQDE